MTESKEVYGMTLYKCPYIKNTWLTEGSCIQQQNKARKELVENYPAIKYIPQCINCEEGIERAKRLGAKLIDVSGVLNVRVKRKRNTERKKSFCDINTNSITHNAEKKAKKLGYKNLADCLKKLNEVKTQNELGLLLGVHKSSIWSWCQKLGLKPVVKTCSIPGLVPTKRTLELEESAKTLGYKSLTDFLLKESKSKSHNQIAKMIGAHPGSIFGWMKRLKNA